jgi:hypothetical protein
VPDLVIAARVTARTQCVALPVPGTYLLNGFARTTGSPIPNNRQTALLHWRLHRSDDPTCTGPDDLRGDVIITNGSAWIESSSPAAIAIPPATFATHRFVSISTVMQTNSPTPRSLKGWFDRIQLTLEGPDIFRDGFEQP